MPLSKIFDLHVITAGFVFFVLGLIVFPYINREMVRKVDTTIWLGIAAPVIGIANMTFATVLVLIAKGYPDDFILDYFLSYLAICLFSLAGYAWHIISINDDIEKNSTPTSATKTDKALPAEKMTDQVKQILNGDK